jgi:very-short-patch-repair endonuclease
MRHPRKRFSGHGKYSKRTGTRLPRKKKFEAVLDTKSGVIVRSQLERRCADFLLKNKIKFQYEPLILLGGRQFRPDFYLPDYNLFLEICGYIHMPFYRDRVRNKEKIYARHGLHVIFIQGKKPAEILRVLRYELVKHAIISD